PVNEASLSAPVASPVSVANGHSSRTTPVMPVAALRAAPRFAPMGRVGEVGGIRSHRHPVHRRRRPNARLGAGEAVPKVRTVSPRARMAGLQAKSRVPTHDT
ncbi:MAG: hypothetical protein WCD11_20000, partial [Solirubrobacteraceae bacterium]